MPKWGFSLVYTKINRTILTSLVQVDVGRRQCFIIHFLILLFSLIIIKLYFDVFLFSSSVTDQIGVFVIVGCRVLKINVISLSLLLVNKLLKLHNNGHRRWLISSAVDRDGSCHCQTLFLIVTNFISSHKSEKVANNGEDKFMYIFVWSIDIFLFLI